MPCQVRDWISNLDGLSEAKSANIAHCFRQAKKEEAVLTQLIPAFSGYYAGSPLVSLRSSFDMDFVELRLSRKQ